MRVMKCGAFGATAVVVLSAFWTQAPAFTLTVNETQTFQSIEGFGPMEQDGVWKYKAGPFYVNANLDSLGYWDTLIEHGGHSCVRADPVTGFQATQGDYSVTGGVRSELQAEQKYSQAAAAHGEVFRILWTCWSPPAWMKANGSQAEVGDADANNYLMPSHFTDYANHWIHLLQIARDTFGVVPYVISLQNEPLFNEPYASCNYGQGSGCGWNGVCYNAMFKVVAPLIRAQFPNLKFCASEDLNRTVIESNLRADATSNPLIWAWATHNDFTNSFAYWTDRPIWNTEPHPTDFMSDAQMCMANIAAGAAAWFDWGFTQGVCQGTGTGTRDLSCVNQGTYNSLRMYARYVRPGAKMITSGGGVSGSYGVIAFYHQADTCLTIIAVNGTASATTATLAVTGSYQPATLNVFTATATQAVTAAGTVAINGTVTLPANSMVTMVAGKYTGTSITAVAPSRVEARVAQTRTTAPARLYSLDGRLAAVRLDASAQSRLAPGVYCTQTAAGSTVARSLQVRGVTP